MWSDANGDGIQDPDEPGIAGVTVVLLDTAGGELARNVTDQFGEYALPYQADGNFLLELELPEGQAATLAHQGSDDERDSHLLTVVDEVRRLARTDVIALPAEHPDGFDFGLVAITAGGGEATTTSSEATTTTGGESTEPPSTTRRRPSPSRPPWRQHFPRQRPPRRQPSLRRQHHRRRPRRSQPRRWRQAEAEPQRAFRIVFDDSGIVLLDNATSTSDRSPMLSNPGSVG